MTTPEALKAALQRIARGDTGHDIDLEGADAEALMRFVSDLQGIAVDALLPTTAQAVKVIAGPPPTLTRPEEARGGDGDLTRDDIRRCRAELVAQGVQFGDRAEWAGRLEKPRWQIGEEYVGAVYWPLMRAGVFRDDACANGQAYAALLKALADANENAGPT